MRTRARFNPRAREGRDPCTRTPSRTSICFNPRAREGRDALHDSALRQPSVSIHAPVKGATGNGTSLAVYDQFQSTRP